MDTAALPTKDVVKLSTKVSGAKHPATLYLIKLYDKAKKLPRIVEEEDLEYWILDCEIRNAPSKEQKDGGGKTSAAAGPIRLSLVIEGEAEEI